MRFAALILFYDCDQFILRTIANCAPHMEKIFVAYSPYPWSYNPEAREKFRNPSDPKILEQSPFRDKVELIEGDWATEEAQRNEVLDKAKAEGFDYLIIQDADEFFRHEDYAKNLDEIEANPDYAYYRTPWYQFWKTTSHVVVCRHSATYRKGKIETKKRNTLFGYSMAFAVNLRTEIRFQHCRRPDHLDDYRMLERPCFHLSYVMSDEQVERKIRTYGHTDQISHDKWLRRKWYGWRESSRCLHPLDPVIWTRAVPWEETLPEEIADLPQPKQQEKKLSKVECLMERTADFWALSLYGLRQTLAAFRK